MDKVTVTKEGYKKLKAEFKELTSVKRHEIANKIKEARDMGDVLENLAYDSFLEEQGLVELRIKEIEETLLNCQIVDKKKNGNAINVGSKVKVQLNGSIYIFEIVSSIEANPIKHKISSESPVGKNLMGKKAGDTVEIKTPVFTAKYIILEIE